MADSVLHDITKATLVSHLTYVAPAWWGFMSAADTSRLQSVITSHGENGSRPQRPLYPRNNDRVHFILHKILYYNTAVSDAMEICFVIIHHVLIDPEFI